MWRIIRLILLFFATTMCYWLFTALLSGLGVTINVLLLFSLAVCVCLSPAYGYPVAFVCGLFLDFFGVKLFGHYAFLFTLCAMLVYSSKNRFDFDAPIPQITYVFILGLFMALANIWMLNVFAGFSAWNGLLPLLGGVILAALLAPAVFGLVRRALVSSSANNYAGYKDFV